ncbi:hypothetical protein [Priestia megaterium]|uniref:hypothetical protein n=1 Tax=Priestia megaterium TaxID=1404 RepID=UPI000BFD7005|nr:hypothetical protein [Priestia megaterium]PGO60750.1 hypothetical protein CN981_09440 [Priestia megaterium]
MLRIALSLLGGLILSWFGFDHLVIHGMLEVFGQHITSTGYYFLFAMYGAVRAIASNFTQPLAKLQLKDALKKD